MRKRFPADYPHLALRGVLQGVGKSPKIGNSGLQQNRWHDIPQTQRQPQVFYRPVFPNIAACISSEPSIQNSKIV
ncbi:hypothetical protein IQ287_12060 [Burkholderia sp. R-69927]|uniref:hypothetical protein n=1 Tax=Paraburkholderia domus TaxID=2793075 RepID=UPI001911B3A8|nr:hypothetical protein [Paraburkholderia domus]MBK5086722.1 hypothetical protein [Burkholderia sp. R-69927]